MDGQKPLSISPQDVYGAIGTAAAPVIIDVRRSAAFAVDNRMIVGAIRRNADEIQNWRRESPSDKAVVVYCVRGHEVSQEAASALRSAGIDARYLEHRIAGWAEYPVADARHEGHGSALLGHPQAAQDRSDRLSLADPAIHRSRSKGAYAAAIGTILGACILLGKIAIGDWLTVLVALGSLAVLFRFKVSNPLLVAATAVIGLIAFPLLQPAWVFVK